MMDLQAGFRAHVESGATTLCTCWRIARTDGVVLGFTDHDEALAFGGLAYLPAHGLEGGEAAHKLGPQVDTTEIVGIINAEAIDEADILLGRYDGAEVETWRVNWRNVAERHRLGRAAIGEIVREDGAFRAELRSGQEALNRSAGRIYQPLCDARLGDGRCGVELAAAAFSAAAVVVSVEDRFRLAVEGIGGFQAGWFDFGAALWSGGRRDGLADDIRSHSRIGGRDILGFAVPVGEWVAPGDGFTARAGCDRRFATCREKFANAVNFRGFPHVPGNDFLLRYPRPGDRLDGRKLVG